MNFREDLRFKIDASTGGLALTGPHDKTILLHPIWLRERVIDPNSYDAHSRQRLYEPTDIDNDIRILSAQINISDRLDVVFNDGLESFVSVSNILSEIGWQKNNEVMPEPMKWTANFEDWPRANWSDITDSKTLFALLQEYYKHGFLLLENTPTQKNSLYEIAKLFGHIRGTNFGLLFDVETKINPTDLADTNLALPAHTDNPYRNPIPSIQFLHCLHNDVKGGLATLVDGLAILDELRHISPSYVDILSTTQIRFRYESDETVLQSYGTLIELDFDGNLRCIRLSSRVDYVPVLNVDTLSKFYEARKQMHALANDPHFQIKFCYEPGLLLMMDNTRLLHGRTAYDNEQGQRLLQGCYIDHDGPDSLFRKLARDCRLSQTDQEKI